MTSSASDSALLRAEEIGAFDWGAYYMMNKAIETMIRLSDWPMSRLEHKQAADQLRRNILRLSSIRTTIAQGQTDPARAHLCSKKAIIDRFNECIEHINSIRSKMTLAPIPRVADC